MEFDEYQKRARKTAIYPADQAIGYLVAGLASECGEVADVYKKTLRDHDGDFNVDRRARIMSELGDTLWYVAMLCDELGVDFSEVAKLNVRKLAKRATDNTLHGSGEER